jgi:hypothetical protein
MQRPAGYKLVIIFKPGAEMNSEKKLLLDLIKALEVVVMERLQDDQFRIISDIPDWFAHLFPDVVSYHDNLRPGRRFPFLANFLSDAEDFWREQSPERLKSGSWIEKDEMGKEYQIEATAVFVHGRELILLESGQYSFKEKKFIFEKGRELNLDYRLLEVFESEQTRQHEEIEKHINQRTLELIEENNALQLKIQDLEQQLRELNGQ